MKIPPLEFHRPSDLDEAVELLGRLDGAKVISGGQSLLPMLRMRLLAPSHLVDLGSATDEVGVRVEDGELTLGFRVTLAQLQRSPQAAAVCPLLSQTLPFVAHRSIRSRGTVAGNIAHADPTSELPAVLALLGGSVTAQGPAGERRIPAADFFSGYYETTLDPGEIVTGVSFPEIARSAGSAFVEVARRHGDFALCGAAAVVDGDRAALGLVGVDVGPRTFELDASSEATLDAGIGATVADLHPEADIHASANYRRHLAGVLSRRALATAAERSGSGAASWAG